MNDEKVLEDWEDSLLNKYLDDETTSVEKQIEEKWAYEEDQIDNTEY